MNAIFTSTLLAVYPAGLDCLIADASGGARRQPAWLTPDNPLIRWIVVGSLIALGLLAARLVYVSVNRWRLGPNGLFLGLCHAHKLRWSDRWLLWHLAGYYRMEDPGRVFVEPERFAPEGLPPHLAGRAARLAELRENLFHEPPPAKERASAFASSMAPAAPPTPPPSTPLFVTEQHPTLQLDLPPSGADAGMLNES
jgi:hypothetical protein